jgi:transposase
MAKKGRRAANEERLIAVQMQENGMSVPEIAEIMNVGTSTVFAWIDKYRKGGLAAISTKAASGRPTTLDDSEMIRLYTMINGKDPRVHGFGMALWTRSNHHGHDASSPQRGHPHDQPTSRTTHQGQAPSPLQPPIAPHR